jgi:ABC-2 type transport system permease protein
VVFGFYAVESSLGYADLYKTRASRELVQRTFGSNAGIAALIGPAHQINTVAGFTEWRALGFLSIVGGVWGLLTGTKLLRGEEEAGRWELYLSGQTTARRATAQALAGLGAGFLGLLAVTAFFSVLAGRSAKVEIGAGPALLFSLAVASSALMFLAVGALAGQLAATRRRAAAYAGVALGIAYALRMVADSGIGLGWVVWTSPLGWVEQIEPLTSPHPWVLLPIAGLTAVVAILAVHLAGVRDLGASTIPDRDSARSRTALLSGPTGLVVRLRRGTVIAWAVAIALSMMLIGSVAKSAGQSLEGSGTFTKVLTRLGGKGGGSVAYLGVGFLIAATLVACVAASQMSATRSEEAEGRLDHLLVRPVSRWAWLGGRIAVAAGSVLVLGVASAVFTWVTAAPSGVPVGLAALMQAGLNIVPPALFVLGVGVLTFGVWPRATSFVLYGLITWSLMIVIIGDIVAANHWILDTSVFHQMATAPAVSPDWTSGAVLVALGAAAAACGAIVFARRDLSGD